MTYARPASLEYTTNAEANRLIAQDPAAFLIGWILDQQVKVQMAFEAPLRLRERIGTLEPGRIAAMPLQELVDAFVAKPALHRYSRAMADRVQQCMQLVVDEYGGDAEQIWLGVNDLSELRRRLLALPGFGKLKTTCVTACLARRFGLPVTGFASELPSYGSLSDITTYDDLLAYQERKTTFKKAARAAKASV